MERITDTHVYFWGSILSNWCHAEFEYKDHKFKNSEQAFMWLKAIHFNDNDTAELILNEPNPKENKALGRKIKGFITEDWELHCLGYMIEVNLAKFEQNKDMLKDLISTGDKTIVEASPYDKIWGIGLHWDDDDVLDESKWKGKNLLGIALMEVRNKLKNRV